MTVKKMNVLNTLFAFVMFALFSFWGCAKQEPDTNKNKAKLSQEQLVPKFDVPALLQMNADQIKLALGVPKSEFKPTKQQLSISPDIKSTLEYQKGTTSIQIDYSANGKVTEIFLSDSKEGRTAKEMYILGNLERTSIHYKTSIQNWLNPALAKKNRTAEIAGIRVTK